MQFFVGQRKAKKEKPTKKIDKEVRLGFPGGSRISLSLSHARVIKT